MTRLKKLFVSLLALVAIACSVLSFTVFATGELTLVTNQYDVLVEDWKYGQTASLPSGSLKLDDEEPVKASVSVLFPDGKTEVSTKEFKITQEGVYTVIFGATFSGTLYEYKQTVEVKMDLFQVTSAESSVEYTTYRYKDHANPETTSKREDMVNSSVEGLQVSLARGDELRFGRVFKANELTKAENIIKMVLTPNELGVKDVSRFTITLTDAFDPTNSIEILVVGNQYDRDPLAKLHLSAGPDQLPTGFQWNADPSKTVKYVNSKNGGTPARFSLTGPYTSTEDTDGHPDVGTGSHNDPKFGINTIENNAFSISYDAATKQVHNTTSAHYASITTMIADLDDPTHFENVWKGFSTEEGYCYLTIKSDSYQTSTFNFVITEMLGVPNLKRYEFNDRGNLDIKVDFGDYEESNLPIGKVNVEYPVFSAFAKNEYFGVLEASYQVKLGNTVVAENGEKFIPTEAGIYEIEYTVKDYFGTTNTRTVQIVVLSEENFTPISFEYEDEVTTGIAGKSITLANVINKDGGSGNLAITKSVAHEDGTPFVVEDNQFFPTKAGKYIVTLTALDFLGQELVVTYDVIVGTGDKPVYVDTPELPKYFISGFEYTLPEIYARDYTTGLGTPVTTKIVYIDGEGTKTAVGRTIKPVLTNLRDTVEVIYYTNTYNGEGNYTPDPIPVIDILDDSNKLIYSNLFYPNNVTFEKADSNLAINAISDGASFEFINSIVSNELQVKFKGIVGSSNYQAICLTLTDSMNHDEVVKLYYMPYNDSKSYILINTTEGLPYELNQSLLSGSIITMELASNGVKFDSSSSTIAPINTYYGSEVKFNGFSSGKVYIGFEFVGVNGSSKISVTSIAGHSIYYTARKDNVKPKILPIGEYLNIVKLNEYIRIPKADVFDVIDPNVKGVVTVEGPEDKDGVRKILRATDGTYLKNVPTDRDYQVLADRYGQYLVTFYAEDCFGNKETKMSYYVNIEDTDAPVITLPKKPVTTGKVNKNITVSGAKAVDNIDGKVEVLIFVYAPSGTMYEIKEGRTFTTNIAGTYKILYVARDAGGNTAYKTVTLTVTE